jgi:hypothetical protein
MKLKQIINLDTFPYKESVLKKHYITDNHQGHFM